uniref:Uncharacterized protein n=1 Tax=Rhizophora mucronata TaxID=61149 RepID=A0A2P2R3R6_RHIMU
MTNMYINYRSRRKRVRRE